MITAETLRFLVFVQGERSWAVAVPGVFEVVRHPRLHPVPSPSPGVAGMLVHDGRALAVLVLEAGDTPRGDYAVVVGVGEDRVALLSDDPGGLESLTVSALERRKRDEAPLLGAVERLWRGEGREIAVLDHRKLVRERRR